MSMSASDWRVIKVRDVYSITSLLKLLCAGSGTLYFTSVRKAKGEPFTICMLSSFLRINYLCILLCLVSQTISHFFSSAYSLISSFVDLCAVVLFSWEYLLTINFYSTIQSSRRWRYGCEHPRELWVGSTSGSYECCPRIFVPLA